MVNTRKFELKQFLKPVDKRRGDKGQVVRSDMREQLTETPYDVRRAGTNYIFNELLGIDNRVVNQYAGWYGDRKLKETSRIAAEIKYATGQNPDLRYLSEAVDQFGGRAVLDLTRMKIDMARLLTDFDIRDLGGMKILTPIASNVSLEKIASAKNITGELVPLGLSSVYRGRKVLVFDYTKK